VRNILADDRKQRILEVLKVKHRATLEELQELTNSSVSTIRRDLNELADEKLLRRLHGGAELTQDLSSELSILEKSSKNIHEKEQIAALALAEISDGDVIFLDAGTTTGAMIPGLRASAWRLSIVTDSVTHASKLISENLAVFILGGNVKSRTDSVIGGQALAQLANYRFNAAFIGANAYDEAIGAMTPDSEEASIKAQAIRQSETAFVLLDSSKLGQTSFVKFANPDEIKILTENGRI